MNKLKEIFDKILGSFTNDSDGYSARKLAAFTIIVMAVSLHIKWFNSNHWEYTSSILGLDFGFISVCLGMTTYENMKKNEAPKD